ncbi:MAG: hypothetical protein AMXMBFR47_26190 [Planctomycetota bacterium]
MTALEQSIITNDIASVKRLISDKVKLLEVDRVQRTALFYAVIERKHEIASILLTAGAAVNQQDHLGWTPLHHAVQNYDATMVSLLIEAGANVNLADSFGNSPLWRAVFDSRGRGEVIRALICRGADPDLKNKTGVSPRELATSIANYDVKSFLN